MLYHLSYEDPYNGKQANLLSSSIHERNETWNEVNCELRSYKWNEDVIIAVVLQFKQLRYNCDDHIFIPLLLLFLAAWMYVGMIGGYLFILLQLVLLIDFAYNWSESW